MEFIELLQRSAKAPLPKGGWLPAGAGWGIFCRKCGRNALRALNPSTAYAVPLPLGEGGFALSNSSIN